MQHDRTMTVSQAVALFTEAGVDVLDDDARIRALVEAGKRPDSFCHSILPIVADRMNSEAA